MPDFTPRPTVYKGIKMRSRLEAGFAGWLDRMELKWEYEPYALGDERGQYLPDFVVADAFVFADSAGASPAVIEVKPTRAHVDFERMSRAAVMLSQSGRGGVMFVCTPGDPPIVFWSSGGFANAVWVHYEPREGIASARLTLRALESPLSREWWK